MNGWQGIVFAFGILFCWAAWTTLGLFVIPVETLPGSYRILFLLMSTYLYTGLFITAHDAMHGTVAPSHRVLNDIVGRVCVFCYALFSFTALKREHRLHHQFPGRENDPDFYGSDGGNFFLWYFAFLYHYITVRQLVLNAICFNVLLHLFEISATNVFSFYVVPAFLSTLQLFYFGTFLPHRRERNGFIDEHRARSNNYPRLLSLLSCFHFGYHWEHHSFPSVPWWGLPAKRDQSRT